MIGDGKSIPHGSLEPSGLLGPKVVQITAMMLIFRFIYRSRLALLPCSFDECDISIDLAKSNLPELAISMEPISLQLIRYTRGNGCSLMLTGILRLSGHDEIETGLCQGLTIMS